MKLRIDNNETVDTFFQDIRIIGIVAPIKNYHFCWCVNQRMQYDLRVSNDLEIQLEKKRRKYYFSIFSYPEPLVSRIHYLYSNCFDGEHLLPELKNLDYLWIVKGDSGDEKEIDKLLEGIRAVEGVQLAKEISHSQIRNKSHLII